MLPKPKTLFWRLTSDFFLQREQRADAVEQGNTNPTEQVYSTPVYIVPFTNNCNESETDTFNAGTDPTHFPLINPSTIPPGEVGCLPSATLSPGQTCVFQATFEPNGTGPYTTTITATPSNGTAGTYLFAGAEFSVSPLSDGENNLNNFQLMLPSPISTPYPGYAAVTLNSGTAALTWNGSLSYHTTGEIPSPAAMIEIPKFDTATSKSHTLGFGATPIPSGMATPTGKLIQVAGGQLTLNVEYNTGASAGAAINQLIGTVSGIPNGIPTPVINSELSLAYQDKYPNQNPPTPTLLEGIALKESTYRQFDYVGKFLRFLVRHAASSL